MHKDPLGVVVIGYGYWSPKLIRNIQGNPGLQLMAICEKDTARHARIREENPGIDVLQHYRDAFARADVQAAVVATIPSSHFRIAKQALEAGKHVLVEKPLSLSVEEAEILTRLAQERTLILMVDHTFLYNPAVGALKKLVRTGELGELYSIESVRANLGLFQRDTNVVWDLAPHDLSILLALIPERPTHISATGSKTVVHPKQARAQESVAHILLQYASGLTAHIHVSWISPVKIRQLTLIGSEKVAVFDQLAASQLVLHDQGVYPNENEGESGPLFIYKTGAVTPVEYDASGEDLARMIADFHAAISSGKEPASPAALGLEVVRLLSAADRSLRSGGKRIPISYGAGNWFRRHLSRLRPR